MINLLPQTAILKTKADYRQRRFIVVAYLFAALLFIASVILATFYLRVHLLKNIFAEQVARAENNETEEFNQLADDLAQASARARALRGLSAEGLLTGLIGRVLSHRSSVNLSGFRFTQNTEGLFLFDVTGRAATRQDFLKFVESLRQDPGFLVESPVSNLIKDRELDFKLKITVQK